MIHEKQNGIPFGFTDYTGQVWPDHWVNSYNNYTHDINKSSGIEIAPDSLTQKERDLWLGRRHGFFVSCCNDAARS